MVKKELSVTIVLKEDLDLRNVGTFIGKLIATLLCNNEELLKIHESNKIEDKTYSYSYFYEKTEDGIYKKGDAHSFRIRSINEEILEKIKKEISNTKSNEYVYFITTEYLELRTSGNVFKAVTPVILMREKGSSEKYFANNIDIEEYKSRLESNILKSYRKQITKKDEKEQHSFIDNLEITTKKAIGTRYKGATMLGHKIKITFKEDDLSQKIKLFCIQNGIGEKTTTIGAGFLEQLRTKGGAK